jgi:hypothetical protein
MEIKQIEISEWESAKQRIGESKVFTEDRERFFSSFPFLFSSLFLILCWNSESEDDALSDLEYEEE